MSNTSTPPLVKTQLSSGLRERLKKCGRYHASPEPAARQSKSSVATSEGEKEQSDSKVDSAFTSPQFKRQCTGVRSVMVYGDDKELTSCHSNKSPLPYQQSNLQVGQVTKGGVENSSINQTPLSQRSRSCLLQVKGSKLNFEDSSTENTSKRQKTIDTPDTVISSSTTSEKSNSKDLVQSDLDPSAVSSSRSGLLKELEMKEEQLRKLRMVKMYRSKNDLEELQTLIDKWRAVSQQAVQDLHQAVPEPRPSLTELINHLGIDHQLLHFSEEDDETFF